MANMTGPQMWNIRGLLDMIEPVPDTDKRHETAQQQEGFKIARRRGAAPAALVVVAVHFIAAAAVYLLLWG